ncbi:RTC4-like domain-containing protein [Cladorrhinum sp. PSN259]|nr:RTC4-like domain-containing protein [Cladorrhinum sp. PSN259]
MSAFQNRRVGMSRSSGPQQSLLKKFRKPFAEPKSDDPPLEESQLSQTHGPSNDKSAKISDPIEDDGFGDLCSPYRSKDEGQRIQALPERSPLPTKAEEDDPDFWGSSRYNGQDPFNSPKKDLEVEHCTDASHATIKQESPRREAGHTQEKWTIDVDDDEDAAPLDLEDYEIPTVLTGKTKEGSIKRGTRGKKREDVSNKRAPSSDSESSDDGAASSRANIRSTNFQPEGRKKSSRPLGDIASSQGSSGGKRPLPLKRASSQGHGLDATYKGPKKNDKNNSPDTKGSGIRKRKSAGDEESDISLPKADSMADTSFKSFGGSRVGKSVIETFGQKAREREQEKKVREEERASKKVRREKKFKKREPSSEPESPKRNFVIPDLIKSDEPSSPMHAPHSEVRGAVPLMHSSSPVKKPPLYMIPSRLEDTDPSSPEKSQGQSWKLPADLSDLEELSWLNSPAAKDALAGSHILRNNSASPLTELDSPSLSDSAPICPLCKKEVNRQYLADYTKKHPVWTVHTMQSFCRNHTKKSAEAFWDEKGYPAIMWRKLDERISEHVPLLRSILEGKQSSHYSDLFQDKIKSGQNRTLLRSDKLNLTPGYYGIRGLRQMSENLIHEFSAILRKRALEDNLIGARGYSTYLQAVLVPELGVRLIMDDMKIQEEEARKVLGESSWVGEVLHDEVADVVQESDEEEEREKQDRRIRP